MIFETRMGMYGSVNLCIRVAASYSYAKGLITFLVSLKFFDQTFEENSRWDDYIFAKSSTPI